MKSVGIRSSWTLNPLIYRLGAWTYSRLNAFFFLSFSLSFFDLSMEGFEYFSSLLSFFRESEREIAGSGSMPRYIFSMMDNMRLDHT